MGKRAPTYIWRKSATPEWLHQNEARLHRFISGGLAVIERPGRKRLEVEAWSKNRSKVQILAKEFGGNSELLPRGWLDRYCRENAAQPLRIGRRLLIRSVALAPRQPGHQSASSNLSIPAGAAFGTGEHATTAMCLRMLESLTRRLATGWRMLDAGTGSGILALAGDRFGAGSIVAVDNDPLAISTARKNARVNRIRAVKFVLGDVKHSLRGRYDIVTANLHSQLLEELLPKFAHCLAPNGRLILSGLLRQQENELVRNLRRHGFRVEEIRRRGKWIALLAARVPRAKTRLTPCAAKRTFPHP